MGVFETIMAAAGGPVGDAAATWYNNRQADKRQHQAQDFDKEMYQHRYQYQVADMAAAGLNPMLSYLNGAPGSPTSSAASASDSSMGSRAVQSYNTTKLNSAQVANVQADTANKVESNALIRENTNVARTTAINNQKLYDKIEAEIANVKQELHEINSRIDRNKSDSTLAVQKTETELKLQGLYEMQLRLTSNQVSISDPEAMAARTWTGSAAAHGKNISKGLSPLTDLLKLRLEYNRGDHKVKFPKTVGD